MPKIFSIPDPNAPNPNEIRGGCGRFVAPVQIAAGGAGTFACVGIHCATEFGLLVEEILVVNNDAAAHTYRSVMTKSGLGVGLSVAALIPGVRRRDLGADSQGVIQNASVLAFLTDDTPSIIGTSMGRVRLSANTTSPVIEPMIFLTKDDEFGVVCEDANIGFVVTVSGVEFYTATVRDFFLARMG